MGLRKVPPEAMTEVKMNLAIYARVSTRDKDQNPENQLLALRKEAERLECGAVKEYVDSAKATDVRRRKAWRQLLDDVVKSKINIVLVYRLDRAFRSVKHMHDTLSVWESLGVDFKSVCEGFDTSSAQGRLLLNILAALAEFELAMISERVRSSMDRVKATGTKSGKPIGRPIVEVDVVKLYDAYRQTNNVRAAARVVGCKPATAWDRLKNAGLLDELPSVRC